VVLDEKHTKPFYGEHSSISKKLREKNKVSCRRSLAQKKKDGKLRFFNSQVHIRWQKSCF